MKNHLRLYHLAESLNASNLGKLTKLEVTFAVGELKDKTEFPTEVLQAILKRLINDEFTNLSSLDSLKELFKLVWCWTSDDKQLDPHRPMVGLFDCTFKEKAQFFKSHFVDTILVGKIEDTGGDDFGLLDPLASLVADAVAEVMPRGGLSARRRQSSCARWLLSRMDCCACSTHLASTTRRWARTATRT